MLVTCEDMLKLAYSTGRAIPSPDFVDSNSVRAFVRTAEELNAPIILSFAEVHQDHLSLEEAADLGLFYAKRATVPVALHLDHGTYEDCFKCIDAGFTSIMYDGSKEPDFATNLARTKELVKIAHNKGLSIEAEVGGIGDGGAAGEIADPNECVAIAEAGVDFLACGIGNIHGLYPEDWAGLNFDVLADIKAKVGSLPLVLHGGTGIPADQVAKAISMGVAKINVNTDLQVAFAKAGREYVEAGLDQQGKGYDPRKMLKPGAEAIVARATEIINQYGSAGRGWE